MPELVTPIRMGGDIPEWLIVAEPLEPGAPRGNFRFSCDVQIVETPDYYVVVPMALGNLPPLLDGSGTVNHRIYAPGKPVHIAIAQQVIFPLSVNAWHSGQPPIEQPSPTSTADFLKTATAEVAQRDLHRRNTNYNGLEVTPAPTARKPGFWARMRWAFLGR